MSRSASWVAVVVVLGCSGAVDEAAPAVATSGSVMATEPSGSASPSPVAIHDFSCPTAPRAKPRCRGSATVMSARSRRVHFEPAFGYYSLGKLTPVTDAIEILLEVDCDPDFSTAVTEAVRVGGRQVGISLEKIGPGCLVAMERESALHEGEAIHLAMPHVEGHQLPVSTVLYRAPPASQPPVQRAGGVD